MKYKDFILKYAALGFILFIKTINMHCHPMAPWLRSTLLDTAGIHYKKIAPTPKSFLSNMTITSVIVKVAKSNSERIMMDVKSTVYRLPTT